jgi:hypothetical protein
MSYSPILTGGYVYGGSRQLTCPSATLCLAVNDQEALVVSTDPAGGAGTWGVTDFGDGTQLVEVNDLACASASFCAASADVLTRTPTGYGRPVPIMLTSTDPGGGPSAWARRAIGTDVSMLTCPSPTLCIGTDTANYYSYYYGGYGYNGSPGGDLVTTTDPTGGLSAWTVSKGAGFAGVRQIVCASASLCLGQDYSGNLYLSTDPAAGWSSWMVQTLPRSGSPSWYNQIDSNIACPSASLCVAGNYQGDIWETTDPGGGAPTWRKAAADNESVHALSCPSAFLCVAGDSLGRILVSTDPSRAGTWAVTTGYSNSPDWNREIISLSCPSPALCVALNGYGDILVGTGHATRVASPVVGMAATPDGAGYWEVAADGGVFAFGGAGFSGSLGGQALNRPIVAMAATPDGAGYWLVAGDGGVFAFGDARYFGGTAGQTINGPVVTLAPTPDGGGYWLFGSDGTVYPFGDAVFHGNGRDAFNAYFGQYAAIEGAAATPTGHGYWMVSASGTVNDTNNSTFGDAGYYGGMNGIVMGGPIVALAASPTGQGYWMAGTDGGVYAFGDALFRGSMGGRPLNLPIVGLAVHCPSGGVCGYWEVAADGGIFAFGDAGFYGSMG